MPLLGASKWVGGSRSCTAALQFHLPSYERRLQQSCRFVSRIAVNCWVHLKRTELTVIALIGINLLIGIVNTFGISIVGGVDSESNAHPLNDTGCVPLSGPRRPEV